MSTFSLEDDDYGDLFITQESKGMDIDHGESEDQSCSGDNKFLDDFASPMKSLVKGSQAIYEDISEDEFVDGDKIG